MNSFLPQLLAALLLLCGARAWSLDPCPICGGKVTTSESVKDDLRNPSRNLEIWNRSMCAMLPPDGSLVCTRCWFLNKWDENVWRRSSHLPDTFFRPLSKPIRDFPVPAGVMWACYDQQFEGDKLTESLTFWSEDSEPLIAGYTDYGKKHNQVIEFYRAPSQPKEVAISVTAQPMIVFEKPLPPKRPAKLKAAKNEYLRSAVTLRTEYINKLVEMLKKAEAENDDLARDNVKRELKIMTLPKDSDTKALSKLLIGKWKQQGEHRPFYRYDGMWSLEPKPGSPNAVLWSIEGNELLQTYPGAENPAPRRAVIILLTGTRFVYVEKDDPVNTVVCEERVAETKRR